MHRTLTRLQRGRAAQPDPSPSKPHTYTGSGGSKVRIVVPRSGDLHWAELDTPLRPSGDVEALSDGTAAAWNAGGRVSSARVHPMGVVSAAQSGS